MIEFYCRYEWQARRALKGAPRIYFKQKDGSKTPCGLYEKGSFLHRQANCENLKKRKICTFILLTNNYKWI